jgi:hypothetical protein
MHGSRSRVEILALLLSLAALAPVPRAGAQQSAHASFPPFELRIDALDVRSLQSGTLQAGAGMNVPLGYYVRLEIDGAGGITRRDSIDRNSARVDVLTRFLLDPFAEASWGLSIGGGISAAFSEGARPHEYLVVVADLEAPRIGGFVPALQIGLGGGVRVGVVARAYRSGRR